jgi:radical SAM protein with 4Fe4S-binding SPASM domain
MIPVKANGDVGLCSFFPNAICNIKEIGDGDGKEFVTNLVKKLNGFVDSIRVDKLFPCADCDVLYFCGGSCRKKNEETFGDPNICECDESFKQSLREKLVIANLYIIEPLTDLKKGGEKDEQDQD